MARIEVTTHVEAPPQRVWEVLTDWERQAEWMVDARSVEVLSAHRTGTGVRLRCRTDILGVVINDELAVTQWDAPSTLAVRHEGRVLQGIAAFELTATNVGTHVVWWEESQVPLGSIGDALAATLLGPWVTKVLRRSLAGLKRLSE